MDWMLDIQLSSKNLSVGEKLAMTDEFREEVAMENEKKQEKMKSEFHGNRFTKKVDASPIGVPSINDKKNFKTDTQVAKKAGVGVGTVARQY